MFINRLSAYKPQLTLLGAFVLTVGIVGYVHYSHELERYRLKVGVAKDLERQKLKRMQRDEEFTKYV